MRRISSLRGTPKVPAAAVKPALLAILLTCVLTLTVVGQVTTGSLNGTISDPSGANVAGATLTLVNTATGAERTTISSSVGAYDFQALQPGSYKMTVEAQGFKKAVDTDITISVATATQVNIPLEIGLAGETVTVMASQEVINTTSPSLTNIVNTRQVVDLPLGDRNPVNLAGLSRYCCGWN